MFKSQAGQDKYVLNVLKGKTNGYFVEVGSYNPIYINNSFILEKAYDWKGVMVEYENKWLADYQEHRPNSIHIINDATKVDFAEVFEVNDFPQDIDYLQIDIEAANGTTLQVLKNLEQQVMGDHRFAVVTFEHDIYQSGAYPHTRTESREIFKRHGYELVFQDVNDNNPDVIFEDWYVHPDLVDMEYVRELQKLNKMYYTHTKYPDIDLTINWRDIVYPSNITIPDSVIVVGPSATNEKIIPLDREYPTDINVGFYHTDVKDTFSSQFSDGNLIVRRTDNTCGWGKNLIAYLYK